MIKNKLNELGNELLSDFKFYSSYSKFNNDQNRYETWDESVDRVFNEMHGIKFENILNTNEVFKEYYEFARKKYKEKYVLASQRSLQFGGEPILKHNAKMYNCITSYCDRIRFFQDTMYWLLCGCGVGFSVQSKHINKLPKIKKRSNRSKVHVIEDSIEGWADAIGILLSSYFEGEVPFPKYQNCYVSFDYTNIRPKGSLISGGFKAPGSDGLRNSILKIEQLFERELNKLNFSGTVESIVAYDVVMYMSDAVLSGGVRRSATICMFSPEDDKMMNAKTGNWFIENPQRARSNNSVLLNKNTLTKEEFNRYFKSVKEFGEPGFGFTEDVDIIYNPCFEIGMRPQTEDGISGSQGCNLVEINGGKCNSEEEFYDACKAAAIIGTMQAAYTDFRYVDSVTKEIFDREALLGCSITGFMNNPDILLNPEIQKNGAEIIKKINKEVASIIGIRQAARTTCVKPSGNACTTFNTKIKTEIGDLTLNEIFNYCLNIEINENDLLPKTFALPKKELKVFDENNELKNITALYSNGLSETYEIEFEDGNKYEFTGEHKLKTYDGWKYVSDLSENDEIINF